ncbi:MAG: hypothetical protein J6A59_03265 [Lachnospiraceae bacterium]|nr:hypothetical protein [Lachnospiraceae bacterium]
MILIDTQKEEFARLKDIRIFGKEEDGNKFNRDLLVIGLGGAGGKVVSNLKGMLNNQIKPEDNINFLYIDSDIPSMEQMIEDSKDGIGLNALEIISIYRPNIDNILENGIQNNPVHPNLANWMRPDFPNITLGQNGTNGNRQVGRLMFSNAYEDMRILLFDKVKECYLRSYSGKLDVILVTSVAGGTGSGIIADVAYNIRALAKVKKWQNFRVGGCLLMPDCHFGQKDIYDDPALVTLLNANGCATLKEIDYLMRILDKPDGFISESTTHRLCMKENIFEACLLVSGKKDEQGYIPDGVIYSDTAYFLFKLATNKYIGSEILGEDRELLRDAFFKRDARGYYKVINEADYKGPIKEIENICEHQLFREAYKKIHDPEPLASVINLTIDKALGEIKKFLNDRPGTEINLDLPGLIKIGQYERPTYKDIKKGADKFRSGMARQLNDIKLDVPILMKSVKNKLVQTLTAEIDGVIKNHGPFIAMHMIGAEGIVGIEYDTGLIKALKDMEILQRSYQSTGEYSRIIESIQAMVSKKLFAFPSAKREAETGYYDACVKEALASERTILVDGFDSQDVFGDVIRMLRQKAERLNEIYSQFDEDLKYAVEDLAERGKKTINYLLKEAKHKEFLPSDYITESRINEVKKGIIDVYTRNEANIDNGRPIVVKDVMEKVYKNALIGIGVYAPEKLISVAFSDRIPTLQETNIMFVSPTNDRREEIMSDVCKAFVQGSMEKTEKKKLCILKDGYEAGLINKKYISLPDGMPYFSKALKELYKAEPYNESEDTITTNKGELEISIDDMYIAVPLSALQCAEDMQNAYDNVDSSMYFGLHTDEVNKDMREYANIV